MKTLNIKTQDRRLAELEALKGAQETIRTWRPRIAVCVYHKRDDLFTIPQYLKQLVPDYQLYFRKHSLAALEAVLYAIKKSEDTDLSLGLTEPERRNDDSTHY